MSSIRDGVRRGEPFVDTGVVAEWALSNKTKNRLAHAYYGNGTVEERIEKVEGEIEEVKGEIQKVEKNLLAIDWNETRTPDAHGRLYYKLSEEQLGKKDEQLRKKEEQLRDLLLVEKQQQTSASSGMVGGWTGAGSFGRPRGGSTGKGHFGWGRGEAKPEGTLDCPQLVGNPRGGCPGGGGLGRGLFGGGPSYRRGVEPAGSAQGTSRTASGWA